LVNNIKFTDLIDILLTITTYIPKIKDFILKDYNSYEFGKLEIINLNGNNNKLLRKYISIYTKIFVSLIIQWIIIVILVLNLRNKYPRCSFLVWRLLAKR
jgi:hypothetical protein